MKKLLAVILAVILSMSVLVTVSACGIIDGITDLINQIQDGENTGGNDNEKENDNDDHTGGGGNSSGTSIDISLADTIKSNLADFGKKTGYEFTVKVSKSNQDPYTFVAGRKDNVFWTQEGSDGVAYVKRSDVLLSGYSLSDGVWRWKETATNQYIDTTIDVLFLELNMYMVYASNSADVLKEAGTETVAGRSCKKYQYHESAFGVTTDYKASVDKELGITMKWASTISYGDEMSSTEFEVLSFKSGAAVNVPALPEAGEDYYDYSGILGWPTNSFTALIPQIPGKISMTAIENGIFSAMSTCTQEQFDAYVSALQERGFTGEATGTDFDGENSQHYFVECNFFSSNGFLSLSLSKRR